MSTGPRAEQPQPDERLVDAIVYAVEASIDYELDDEARQIVHDTARRHQTMAMKLRAVPLRNADEPDFVFVPYRSEG